MPSSSEAKLQLGIDWGTHSSKWACSSGSSRSFMPTMPLYNSDLMCEEDSITFSPHDDAGDERSIRRGVKGLLINDPRGTPFWDVDREDTGTSLGEAVAFSMCCLLNDAISSIPTSLHRSNPNLEIVFSFPNWLVDQSRDSKAATQRFCDAVSVALHIVAVTNSKDLPSPHKKFSIRSWKALVNGARATPSPSSQDELNIENVTRVLFRLPDKPIAWGFLTESGAAGLPYLRAMKIHSVPGAPGLAKLLVIDVGAGSTDVGYMLRVRHRETGKEKLYFFPPASSFPVAGNQLTREIMNHFRARSEPLTIREAEARKLQRTNWHSLPFANAWKEKIVEHVHEYVEGVKDEIWMPLPIPLNIVLTGGSGLVPGLKEAVQEAVLQAFQARGFTRDTIAQVKLQGAHLPDLSFKAEAEYARRAVCLGATDKDRPGCTYLQSMQRSPAIKISRSSGWV
jgi:hypothetical protein